jgi:hypothetical protein
LDDTTFEICELVCAGIGEPLATQRSAIRKYPASYQTELSGTRIAPQQ